MKEKINIFVNDESDFERAYALKSIIKQDIYIHLEPNLNIKNHINKIFQKEKYISVVNCNEIVIKPYNSKLILKSFFIFLDLKLEGLRKRIPFLRIKSLFGMGLQILRNYKFIPYSKTICTNRGMDIKPIFPTMEQIISGRYLAYGKLDKAIAEENGIKVESEIGYYNYNLRNKTIPNSILLRPTYFSNGTNDKRVAAIIEKLGRHTLNRTKNLNFITLHPDCKEWKSVYKKQIKFNWTLETRPMVLSMTESSTIICDICSTFFASLYLQKDIYLISRKISKPIHYRLCNLINKYILLIPTIDDIIDFDKDTYPKKAKEAILELKNQIF